LVFGFLCYILFLILFLEAYWQLKEGHQKTHTRVIIMVDKICIRCKKKKAHYAKGLCKWCYNQTKYSDKYEEY